MKHAKSVKLEAHAAAGPSSFTDFACFIAAPAPARARWRRPAR
jgi:hypothetical protein